MNLLERFKCWTGRHEIPEEAEDRLTVEYERCIAKDAWYYFEGPGQISVMTKCARCGYNLKLKADDEDSYYIIELDSPKPDNP